MEGRPNTVFSSPHFTDFNMLLRVRIDGALVAENLRLVWVNAEAFLKSHIIFRICSLEVANNITSSANLKFVRQSRSWSLSFFPFLFFCQHFFFLQRVLKHCVEQQAGHLISLLRSFLDVENFALFVCLSVPKPSGLCFSSSGG